MLAYTIVAVIYNLTEAGFRMLHPMWLCLLVAMVISNAVAAGVIGGKTSKTHGRRRGSPGESPTIDRSVAEGQVLAQPEVNWKSTAAYHSR